MPKLLFRDDLLEALRDSKEAGAYLEAALREDLDGFLSALKDVAEAQGGMSRLAKAAKLNRAGVYRMFSKKGNPAFRNIMLLLDCLGYEVRIEKAGQSRRAHAHFRFSSRRLRKAA